MDPAGQRVYVVGAGSSIIISYSIDQTSGVLTQATQSQLVGKNGAYALTIEPTGHFAYTAGEGGATIGAYAINNGALTAIAGFPISGALGSLQVTVDPSGNFVYFPQTGSSNNISSFRIDHTNGGIQPISGSPFPAGTWPTALAITAQ
ncbi:MAG: hypothetical protein JWO13_2066 [Acidobacteriales bacterium]|nr:hypothetical protein [Terriglobales bacterium]